ncbi:MAG: hypothetical protein JWO78_1303 [Micavibrio sp.]|nr:hypothetical protein [Micavibrio sp.]
MILIGVVLFAALSFTYTRNSQQSADNLTQRQAELAASDIVTYAQRVSRTVNSMLSKGFSETQISFEGMDPTYIYTNTNCTDDSCKVFGGSSYGIQPSIPVDNWLDYNGHQGDYAYKTWYITPQYCIPRLPDATQCSAGKGNDLVLLLPYLKQSLCEMINVQLHLPVPVPTPSSMGTINNGNQFSGNFNIVSTLLDDAALNGQSAGCVRAGSTYYFYQVLMQR